MMAVDPGLCIGFSRFFPLGCFWVVSVLLGWSASYAHPRQDPLPSKQLSATTASIPFTENIGQYPEGVRFAVRTFSGSVSLTQEGLVYAMPSRDSRATVHLIEHFVGGSLRPQGDNPSQAVVSYFRGDRTQWHARVPSYDRVALPVVWDGIDVAIAARGNNIEKLFTVAPGIDPANIRMRVEGAVRLRVDDATGELVVVHQDGELRFTRPVAFQLDALGEKSPVLVGYSVSGAGAYSFSLGAYDETRPLIIDPLIAATYLGGTGSDVAKAVQVTQSGDIVVCGTTDSGHALSPGTSSYDSSMSGATDAFVARFSSDLSSLIAFTFLGGSGSDQCNALIESSFDGDIVIAGSAAAGFPIVPGAYAPVASGGSDGFVAVLSPLLDSLVASTYIGGAGEETIRALEVMPGPRPEDERWVVAGQSSSLGYPIVPGAYEPSLGGASDVVVSIFSRDLGSLVASTFLGAAASEGAYGLAVSPTGDVYVAGEAGAGFPSSGGVDTIHNGATDCFVARLSGTLGTLIGSTLLGGSAAERCSTVLWSAAGVYVAGETFSSDLPVTLDAYDMSFGGSSDAFVGRLSAALDTLEASTYIGGATIDRASALLRTVSGDIIVVGAGSSGYPETTTGPSVVSSLGGIEFSLSRFSEDLSLLHSSILIGGVDDDEAVAAAIDENGYVVAAGFAGSDFPSIGASYQSQNTGLRNAAIAKVNVGNVTTPDAVDPMEVT